MSGNWTPGPWVALRNSAYWEVDPQNRSKEDPYTVCDVCSSAPFYPDGGLQEANARLIAAAPELYEALSGLIVQALQSTVSDPANEYGAEAIAIALAALAKARGES